jgi:hypothetical protein
VAKTGSGDVYAGRDGNVYKNDGGGWQKYDNGGWSSVEKPQGQATADQLNRDRGARADGTQRTSDLSSVRSSGVGSSRAGSYRPSGGGRAGGGGGRRR